MNFFIKKISIKLHRKILTGVLIVSGLTTLIISSIQIYGDYSKDIQGIKERLSLVESSYLAPIENSIWEFNEKQISISLKGIINLPDIEYAKIEEEGKILFSEGVKKSDLTISKTIFLKNKSVVLGTLVVVASTQNAMKRVKEKIVFTTLSKLIETLISSFFILLLVQILITRHVETISNFFLDKKIEDKGREIILDRRFEFLPSEEDELDQLVHSINLIMQEVDGELIKRKRAETELVILNKNLETKVEDKTKQLLESNKMIALSEMAGGIAHEINTPLTVLHGRVRRITKKIEKQEFSREETLDSLKKLQGLIERIFTITNGLRYFSIDIQKEEFADVNINSIIFDAITFCRERYRNMNVPLSIKSSQDELILSCKGNSLIQMIVTIIKTSLTSISMDKNSWCEVETKVSDNQFVIIFRDSAIKINEEIINFIETPFSESSGIMKGSGLELGMIKGIVEAHNGNLWVNKENGTDKIIIKLNLEK